jgi:hypothetical protein
MASVRPTAGHGAKRKADSRPERAQSPVPAPVFTPVCEMAPDRPGQPSTEEAVTSAGEPPPVISWERGFAARVFGTCDGETTLEVSDPLFRAVMAGANYPGWPIAALACWCAMWRTGSWYLWGEPWGSSPVEQGGKPAPPQGAGPCR